MADPDLTNLLRDWPYEPGQVKARLIEADDGRTLVQMRLDLGIMQMESAGRPDGQKCLGAESWLAYYEERRQQHTATQSDEAFVLSPEDCNRIREEIVQHHHRYVALFVLDEYDGVLRDAEHNLRLIELCRQFGASEEEQTFLMPLLPHTIMMRCRAQVAKDVEGNDTKAALAHIDLALSEIRALVVDDESDEEEVSSFDESGEVQLLRSLRESLVPKLPVSQRTELNERLKQALAEENYKLAAILRDELKSLKE